MKTSRIVVILLTVAFLATAVHAQAAESVLKRIPAGSAGYLVINNVKTTARNVDTFLRNIGMGMMVPPGGVLPLIKSKAMLGPGFNADGGFAVVLLDPQQYGLDIKKLITGRKPNLSKIPVVMLVPGSGVKEVFGPMAAPAGIPQYFKVNLPGASVFATHKGGYVLLSPCQPALKAFTLVTKTADSELKTEHASAISKSDIAVHLNMKVVGVIVNSAIKDFERNLAMAGSGAKSMSSMKTYRDIIKQINSVTITMRLAPTGVAIDYTASFKPGSQVDRALRNYSGTPLLDCIPDLPYVVAAGQLFPINPAALALNQKNLNNTLDSLPTKLSPLLRARVLALSAKLFNQITSTQFVVGGAPEGSGVFGVALLIKCRNAKTVKSAMPELAEVLHELIKTIEPNDQTFQQFKISHSKNTGNVGGIKIDTINISHPDIKAMAAKDGQQIKKIMGETRIDLRIASPDNKTVVITLGGAKAFMSKAIEASKGGGRIFSRRQRRKLAKYMPKKIHSLALINVANLMDVVMKAVTALEPRAAGNIPFRITTREPVVISSGTTGKAAYGVLYVPNKLIKELVQVGMMMFSGMGGGGMGPAGPPPAGF